MTPQLYAALAARADGRCECGCGHSIPPGEVDHFFSRSKAEETLETCWVLRPVCHYEKTRNWPSARHWIAKFIVHADRYAYRAASLRAQLKLDWNTAMGVRS